MALPYEPEIAAHDSRVDVLSATPTVVIYVLSSHPLLSVLVFLIVGIAFYYKSTGFKLRRFLDEIVISSIPAGATSPLIPLAEDFDEWIWKGIKLTDTISRFLVYFNDRRLAYIEHQLEHVTALEEKVPCVPVLEQANAALETDNATLKEDNAVLEATNAGLKEENATLKTAATDNATSSPENATLKRYAQEVVALKHANTELSHETAALKENVARQARESRSATEEKLRADVTTLKKKVDPLRKQREAHLADDSARTLQYHTDLVKVTSERDAAIAEREAADAQHEATHRPLLDMTSAKDAAVTEKDTLATRQTSTARALATMTSAWKAAKKEKDQAVAQRDEAQRAVADAVSAKDAAVTAKDAAVTAKDEAVAAKEKAEAEYQAAVAAKEASEATLVAMKAERDASVTETEVAKKAVEDATALQADVTQKAAQKRIKELTKANESLTNDNATLKGEIVKIQTSCNNFKNLNNQNMNRMKIVRRDRYEWKDAHDRQVNEVASKTATLLKAESDLRESVRRLEEQEKLVTQLAARITELELGFKDDACDDATRSRSAAQQHTPPASPDREGDTADEVPNKKLSKSKFQLPAILVRRSASDLNEKVKAGAAATPRPAVAHTRIGSDSSTSTGQRDSIASLLSQNKRPTPTHSRAGSRSSTTTLQRDSIASSLAQQTLFNNLAALSLPRDMRTT